MGSQGDGRRRAWPTREGGHAVSSHFVHQGARRPRSLLLAAACTGALASLAVPGPMLAQSEEPAGEVYTVNATTTDLGTFLTDADGRTLYIFLKDTAPGASVCEGDCLANWPAFGPTEGQALTPGEGVTGVLGSFTRADGTSFATYDGRPLYYFIGDQAAGDTNGQGIGNVWYVATVDGSVPAPAASEAPAESPTALT